MAKMKVKVKDTTANNYMKRLQILKNINKSDNSSPTSTHFLGVHMLNLLNIDIIRDILDIFESLGCQNFKVMSVNDNTIPIGMVGLELVKSIDVDEPSILKLMLNEYTTISL